MGELVLLEKKVLVEVLQTAVLDRYSDTEVCAATVCDLLKISKPTLNRWVEKNIIKTSNESERRTREVRYFNLAYILGLNKKALKSEYREVNIA